MFPSQIDAIAATPCSTAHALRRQSQSRPYGRPRPLLRNPSSQREPAEFQALSTASAPLPAATPTRSSASARWLGPTGVSVAWPASNPACMPIAWKRSLGEHCPTRPQPAAPSANSATTRKTASRYRLLSGLRKQRFVKLSRYENASAALLQARNELRPQSPLQETPPTQTKSAPALA